jgi:hypothetical protein
MTIQQLFNKKPPKYDLINMIEKLGFDNLEDNKSIFTKHDIKDSENDVFWIDIFDKLKNYYLPCKYKVYCDVINPKKIITIFRHCLKIYGYKLASKEKYISGKKYIIYFIVNNNLYNTQPSICTIKFD